VLAVDIPSGVNASTGEVEGAAVDADVTVTMHGRKVGLVVGPGRFHAGDVIVVDIGLEPRRTADGLVTRDVLERIPRRRDPVNKYSAGSVLVVGGARGMTGAAALTARAAFRADAGYVAIAAPSEALPTLETLVVEAVKRPLEDAAVAAERASALALGPGLGRDQKPLVRKLLTETKLPAVVDADGLHELEPFERNAATILTPHSGELGRLIDEEAKWVDAHRLEALARAVERFRCVVLLKGADTLIGAPDAGVWVVGDNVPALATAGTGDVLTEARPHRERRRRSVAVMSRSELTIDLGALRRNVRTLLRELDGAALWAVVKADGYGHGAVDVSRAALEAGASALCVATVAEAFELRTAFPEARILCMGPADAVEVRGAREANVELAYSGGELPENVRVHVKLDTGMGRYGVSELPALTRSVVGLMSHLATADTDPAFARAQVRRFDELVAPYRGELDCHIANSAAALRLPEARFDAARCGVAIYGLSPFGDDPAADGLEPVLSWRSRLAQVKLLQPGQGTGYRRRFVAERATWIGLVPLGYADGFRRDLTGTRVVVDGGPADVIGTVSMDSFAVRLPHELPVGTPVTLIGEGVRAESHAKVAGTINYEIATGIRSDPRRAARKVVNT
jgi:alanine racemase